MSCIAANWSRVRAKGRLIFENNVGAGASHGGFMVRACQLGAGFFNRHLPGQDFVHRQAQAVRATQRQGHRRVCGWCMVAIAAAQLGRLCCL